jgi:hypothetical protein
MMMHIIALLEEVMDLWMADHTSSVCPIASYIGGIRITSSGHIGWIAHPFDV